MQSRHVHCAWCFGLAAALDRTKMTDRGAVFILTEAARSFGVEVAELNINRSSIARHRKRNREEFAENIKADFSADVPLVVHWDGKMVESLTTKEHVDRLPVLVSGKGVEKLLGVPKLQGGSGEQQAAADHAALEEWQITDRVKAMRFDTTACNTGARREPVFWKGSWEGTCLIWPAGITLVSWCSAPPSRPPGAVVQAVPEPVEADRPVKVPASRL